MSQPKVNGTGRECPEWCATDHTAPPGETDNCRTARPPYVPSRDGSIASYWAFASLEPFAGSKPYVAAGAPEGMLFARTPEHAKELGGFVRSLADLTPAKIRAFAAQVDRAADVAFGAKHEPEAGT